MEEVNEKLAEKQLQLEQLVQFLTDGQGNGKATYKRINALRGFANAYNGAINAYEKGPAGTDMSKYKNVVMVDLLASGGQPNLVIQPCEVTGFQFVEKLGLDIPAEVQSRELDLQVAYVQRQLQHVLNEIMLLIHENYKDDLRTMRTLGYCIGAGSVWVHRPEASDAAPDIEIESSSGYDFQ